MNEAAISNKFSWHRVGMIARFYYPSLRLPLMIYPAVSLVLGLFTFWLSKTEIGFLFSGLLSMVMSLMFYFFPLFFTRPSSPVVESMIPATAGERLTVFAAACLILNPILTYIPYCIIYRLFVEQPEIVKEVLEVTQEFTGQGKSYALSIAQALPPMITCMFIVFTRWKNRISAAIGFTILSMVALGMLGGIMGAIFIFTDLIPIAEQNPATLENGVELGRFMADKMYPMLITIGSVCIIYTVSMVWLMYRKIRNQQL